MTKQPPQDAELPEGQTPAPDAAPLKLSRPKLPSKAAVTGAPKSSTPKQATARTGEAKAAQPKTGKPAAEKKPRKTAVNTGSDGADTEAAKAGTADASTATAKPTRKPTTRKPASSPEKVSPDKISIAQPSPDQLSPEAEQTLALRLERYRADLEGSLQTVYGQDQVAALWPRLEAALRRNLAERPAELRRLDEARLLRPDWLQAPEMIGYVAYVDRFAGTLKGVAEKVPYLEELGVSALHLMPLLEPRPGENDGGYAVQNYRAVRGDLGTMDDLKALAGELHGRGISLELDLVLNHVAQEHDWAVRARAGEARYRDYFRLFPDRALPDAYERTLPEVFPEFAPGNFTWNDEAASWVWTTFNSYQWDLNWANPEVFLEFVETVLFLANQGVDILRLDAIAFIWKRLGSDSQNQPEVHDLTRALRACARIVAPAVAFKAEAIVAPTDLISYLGVRGHHGKVSDTAYHNSLMVQLWSSLASRSTRLFEQALSAFPPKPSNTTWSMYLRCHDDIGWAISDHDAGLAGTVGWGHRAFLSDFYSNQPIEGELESSFARGLVFQANPHTGDRRISGSAASLAGLEAARSAEEVDLSLGRLRLLHAVVLGYGGLPLLYMGDELAMLNDYGYVRVPEHAPDNRWVHRPVMDWATAERRRDPLTLVGRMYGAVQKLIQVRKGLPHLHASIEAQVVPSPNDHVLLLRRAHPEGNMLGLYNFSEEFQPLSAGLLSQFVGGHPRDALSGHHWNLNTPEVALEPYGAYWLVE